MAIDITEQVVGIVSGAVGKAFIAWPQKVPKAPFAVVDIISRTVELADSEGAEIRVRLAYSVGVLADKPSSARELALKVADAMAAYNFHTTGFTGTYGATNHLYRTNISFSGAVDVRGNTFS